MIPSAVIAVLIALGAFAVALLAFKRAARDLKRRTAELYVARMELEQERSARKRTEEELRFSETTYRAMLNHTRDMVLIYRVTPEGMPGNLVEVNDVACKRLHQTREKLLTMTPLDIEFVETDTPALRSRLRESDGTLKDLQALADTTALDRESSLAVRQLIRQILEERHLVYERTFVAPNGQRIPVEITALGFELDGQPMIVSTAHDIAARKGTEKSARDSERRFRDFFTNSPLGVAIYDAHQRLVDVNPSFLRMLGIPGRAEFAQFNLFDNPFLPDSVKANLAGGQSVRCELAIDFDEARAKRVLLSAKKGHAYFDVLITHLGFDAEFNPKGWLAQVVDTTQRRTTEDALRQSARQLRQAQKMESVGTLAGGIAHDFNNILTPIIGYAEIALDSFQPQDDVHGYLKEILKAGHRAKSLVNQILAFSRKTEDPGARRPVLIAPILKEVLALLHTTLPESIQINHVIKTDRGVVLADPTQIHQVLMNLCTNAFHAMKDKGGVIEVRMTDFVLGLRPKSEFPGLEPGRYLRISVKDTGCGIDRAVLDRIFEPFFTTKRSGEGTGMGLSVVHGIVTSLGGTITVDSEPGKGSVFHVILPLLEQEPPLGTEEVEHELPKGHESVLFVDDEPDIAQVVLQMLASLGYDAVIATSSRDALAIFKQTPDRFHLLITDQVMPGEAGTELAREIRALRPDLPVILCSGFNASLSEERADLLGIHHFLAKPISRSDLAVTIRKALAPPAA